MSSIVHFAIVGAGMIARFHANSMKIVPNVRLAGFYDINHESAKRLAEEFNCKAYSSAEELWQDSTVQAITIATPSGLHSEIAVAAARAGKHILCEKPLDVTRPKVLKMLQECQQNNVFLVPVFQSRFSPETQKIKYAMQQGRFGKMLFASARMPWFRSEEYYASSSWRGTWSMDGGGALMNQAIHTVDQLIFINGLPESVFSYAATRTHNIEVEDNLCAAIRYNNGSFGTFEASTSCSPGYPKRLEFTGTTGSVILEEDRFVRWEFENMTEDDKAVTLQLSNISNSGGSDPTKIPSQGHAVQIADLAEAILTGKEPMITPQEGYQTMEFIWGIYESERTGKPYNFNFSELFQ